MRSRQGVLHCVGCRLDVRLGASGADNVSVAAEDANVGGCDMVMTLPISAHTTFARASHCATSLLLRAQCRPGAHAEAEDASAQQVQSEAVPVSADASPQSTPGGAGDSDDGTRPSRSAVRSVIPNFDTDLLSLSTCNVIRNEQHVADDRGRCIEGCHDTRRTQSTGGCFDR